MAVTQSFSSRAQKEQLLCVQLGMKEAKHIYRYSLRYVSASMWPSLSSSSSWLWLWLWLWLLLPLTLFYTRFDVTLLHPVHDPVLVSRIFGHVFMMFQCPELCLRLFNGQSCC